MTTIRLASAREFALGSGLTKHQSLDIFLATPNTTASLFSSSCPLFCLAFYSQTCLVLRDLEAYAKYGGRDRQSEREQRPGRPSSLFTPPNCGFQAHRRARSHTSTDTVRKQWLRVHGHAGLLNALRVATRFTTVCVDASRVDLPRFHAPIHPGYAHSLNSAGQAACALSTRR